ncbi:MAG TPA: HPr family phosphocarrier protein [Puia sp.]|nr:HPr family phosphocarrier protein [Puia sp.]
MIEKNYLITATEGLHARPATNLIRLVKKYKSATSLRRGDKTVRLNSMLNILSMALKGGDGITILVEGEDEAAAAAAIDLFFTEELKKQ